LLGTATEVADEAEKVRGLHAIVEHVVPGRWDQVRPPSARELRATMVLRLPIREASAKIRTGGPLEDPEDLGSPVWAGHIPIGLTLLPAVADDAVPAGTPTPRLPDRGRGDF